MPEAAGAPGVNGDLAMPTAGGMLMPGAAGGLGRPMAAGPPGAVGGLGRPIAAGAPGAPGGLAMATGGGALMPGAVGGLGMPMAVGAPGAPGGLAMATGGGALMPGAAGGLGMPMAVGALGAPGGLAMATGGGALMPGAAEGLGMPMAVGAPGALGMEIETTGADPLAVGGTRRGPAAGGVSGATGTPVGFGIDGEGTTVPITCAGLGGKLIFAVEGASGILGRPSGLPPKTMRTVSLFGSDISILVEKSKRLLSFHVVCGFVNFRLQFSFTKKQIFRQAGRIQRVHRDRSFHDGYSLWSVAINLSGFLLHQKMAIGVVFYTSIPNSAME